MTAIAGEPFRGLALVSIENDVDGDNNWRRYAVSITDVDLSTLDAGGDQADWEYHPASAGEVIAVTLRLEWALEGVPTAGAADTVSVQARLRNGGAQVGGAWTPAIAGDSGSATTTLRFDDDPLNASVGSARWGDLELYVQVSRAAAVAWGPADSRGAYASPIAATHNDWCRGYLRRSSRQTEHSVSNASIGGAEPSTFAWHDPVHIRCTVDAVAYETATLNCRIRDSGANIRSKAASGTAVNFDFSFTGAGEPVDNDFDNDSDDLRFDWSAADFGGDNAFIWATSGHQAGFARTSELILDDAERIPVSPDLTLGAVTLSQSIHNREETATVSLGVTNGRSEAVTESLSFQIKDSGGAVKKSFTDAGATYGDGGTSDYVIAATDKATFDLVGDQWTLNGNVADATFANTRNVYKVSRMWQLGKTNAAVDNGIKTGKTAGADDATVRNRGQTLHFDGFVYNCRGALLTGPTVNFNVRPTGSETYEESNDTVALSAGQFTDSYTVDADEATGNKCLVIGSQTTASANQPRTGTAGSGNFAETSTGSPEWSVSSAYTVLVRTQKESARNADAQDTSFTIGEDVVYEFVNVTDASSDAVVGAVYDAFQINPAGSTTQSFTGGTTSTGGWNADPGQAFDSRAPAGSGWIQRATLTGAAANNGNTGTDDQGISMLSAFTANKNITIFLGPFANQPNGLGYAQHTAPGNHPRPGDGIGITISLAVSGARVVVDATPVPQFSISVYNPPTQRQKFLQSDGTFKSRNEAGFAEQFFDFKSNLDDGYVWVVRIGTAAQNVTASNGHIFDTSTWPSGILAVNVSLFYNSQEFRDDDAFLFIPPSGQHPYNTRRELSVGRMEI